MTQLQAITQSSEVIVTCGTGGVGKTSIAAALGVVAAQQGRRVVVVTIDPARRLLDAIGLHDNTGNEILRVPLDSAGDLWVTMLDVRETFDNLVRSTSPTPERARGRHTPCCSAREFRSASICADSSCCPTPGSMPRRLPNSTARPTSNTNASAISSSCTTRRPSAATRRSGTIAGRWKCPIPCSATQSPPANTTIRG